MNLPNKLTLSRLAVTFFFVAALTLQWPKANTCALILFLIATITDYLDGQIARRRNLVTDFGKLMDPLADKILVASAFIVLVKEGAMPAWAVIIIISREFLITGLRTLASAKSIVLPAEKIGKHKTAWQMVTAIFFLTLLALSDWVSVDVAWYQFAWHKIGAFLVYGTTILTLYSGLAYLIRHRSLIDER
ncbi:MAG: CDP-diacylglycerol--glycerol-3-phosphate 3-phosphatidyltransferase [Chthoniobacterales bacterium]